MASALCRRKGEVVTVVDPALTPHRARRAVVLSLVDVSLPAVVLPLMLVVPEPWAPGLALLAVLVPGQRQAVKVWATLDRPTRRQERLGVRSSVFVRFWAGRAGWPQGRLVLAHRLLMALAVAACLVAVAMVAIPMVTRGG